MDSQSQQISCDITSIIRNRSPMWFKETVSRVKIIIDEIFPSLTLNDHWKVRQTVAVCGGRIFQQCSLSLSVCISAVLDSLMILRYTVLIVLVITHTVFCRFLLIC